MEIKIETTANIHGRIEGPVAGMKLYAVTTIDQDDAEDTTTEMWIAKDDDDLAALVKEEYCGEDDGDEAYDYASKLFESEWGLEILSVEIANIK